MTMEMKNEIPVRDRWNFDIVTVSDNEYEISID